MRPKTAENEPALAESQGIHEGGLARHPDGLPLRVLGVCSDVVRLSGSLSFDGAALPPPGSKVWLLQQLLPEDLLNDEQVAVRDPLSAAQPASRPGPPSASTTAEDSAGGDTGLIQSSARGATSTTGATSPSNGQRGIAIRVDAAQLRYHDIDRRRHSFHDRQPLKRRAHGLAVGETVILMTPPCLPLLKRPLKVEGGAAG